MKSTSQPIGIFDSGVGGLTVLQALRERMPGEQYLYLGDTARLPYGTKTESTVRRYALNAATHLIGHGDRRPQPRIGRQSPDRHMRGNTRHQDVLEPIGKGFLRGESLANP